MPTFQGQVSEEQLMQLIAYIKSLRRRRRHRRGSREPLEADDVRTEMTP